MAASKPEGVLISLATFVADVDGTEHYVQTGQRMLADHPVVVAHPNNFRVVTDLD